ncbi:MAG TPA: glycolate oxidase subunit GlcF [Gammaproteobacteria bacterium]|nr:glycolate oxidase subunit GlcF [Gammaproteobacteria bacterium]
MQTHLADFIKDTPAGREADRILRNCVHCGFCTATCPTYQLLGDELDGPRGRIYLIKQVLEGHEASRRTQHHLDRCLTCRACETTCPSGVEYGHLADIGREVVESQVRRPLHERLMRRLLRLVLPYPARFGPLFGIGQRLRPWLPRAVRRHVPPRAPVRELPAPRHSRRMLILEGCVQPVMAPHINDATARVLDRLGISLVRGTGGCCGALSQHLSAPEEARDFMRRNIDAWWPYIEAGIEAIVITASGCGTVVKEYDRLLADDPAYADKARRVADLAKDLGEVLREESLEALGDGVPATKRVAFHSPCTLQHGQQLNGVVESILRRAGVTLTQVADAHLCCGSAGTYSILQRDLSQRLLANKVQALAADAPTCIATANIGCWHHLQSRAEQPVRHWIELLDS